MSKRSGTRGGQQAAVRAAAEARAMRERALAAKQRQAQQDRPAEEKPKPPANNAYTRMLGRIDAERAKERDASKQAKP